MFNYSGAMLTGHEIQKQIQKGNIEITPYDEKCINPNSYNLKLHPQLLTYDRTSTQIDPKYYRILEDPSSYAICNIPRKVLSAINPLDMLSHNRTAEVIIPEKGYVLLPGVLYIGRTVERTTTDKYIPMINGRSSGGRLGLSIHICAGFGDIGFSGTWTLEITVVEPLIIYPNQEIAQICFYKPYGKVKDLYRGRYIGQTDATPSRFYKK